MTKTILSIITLVATLPSLSQAQEASSQALAAAASPVDDGRDVGGQGGTTLTHEGFMLRGSAGLALVGTGIDHAKGAGVGAGGVGHAFALSVGGYVVPNLALHAELLRAASSHVVIDTDDHDTPTTHSNALELIAAGMGMTYCVMPYNLSLTGALMLGQMTMDRAMGAGRDTDYVVLAKLGIAKQWAMTGEWGLGVGATLLAGAGHGKERGGEGFDVGVGGLSIDAVATYD